MIPGDQAGALKADFDAVASAVRAGDCTAAQQALGQAQNHLDQLPGRVSLRLRRRLQEGIDRLHSQVPDECLANSTQTQTVPTVTTQTETTPPPATTTAPPPATTPTPTTPTPTTTSPTTTPTTGGATGGVTVP